MEKKIDIVLLKETAYPAAPTADSAAERRRCPSKYVIW